MEKLQWDFVWNGNGMEFKFHLLGKWLWCSGMENDPFWRPVVGFKYGVGRVDILCYLKASWLLPMEGDWGRLG